MAGEVFFVQFSVGTIMKSTRRLSKALSYIKNPNFVHGDCNPMPKPNHPKPVCSPELVLAATQAPAQQTGAEGGVGVINLDMHTHSNNREKPQKK
jgi:hypothetical protein